MIINIEITQEDKKAVFDIISKEEKGKFVLDRKKIIDNPQISKENFWHSLMIGVFTSQQKSGPDSPVNKLLSINPFPLSIKKLEGKQNIKENDIENILDDYKGLRFTNRISGFIVNNLKTISTEWTNLEIKIESVLNSDKNRKKNERDLCRFLQENFIGIGPKQSRNIIQASGIAKYEIPIDSRFVKWIHANIKFPIPISSNTLSDENYYSFILDVIQLLSEECNILPAVLDACIFASFDNGRWDT